MAKKRKNKSVQPQQQQGGEEGPNKKKKKNKQTKPLSSSTEPTRKDAYPAAWHGLLPKNGKFVGEDGKDFPALLEGPFNGIITEDLGQLRPAPTQTADSALRALEPLYHVDVTQPLGLSTPLARTYVRRCLVGEPGVTYKYLGLRMFAHPWRGPALAEYTAPIAEALRGLKSLDTLLKGRSKDLGAQKAEFSLSLINRMVPGEKTEDQRIYKCETEFNTESCAVSWHADSCLENFSTIAVYQSLGGSSSGTKPWRLALRVRRDAEGPSAGRARRSGHEEETPAIALALPRSAQAYYMLDNFNHHHQHAVLAGEERERWSSTHRVAKSEGHTLEWALSTAKAALEATAHSLKNWALRDRAIAELEFEWLRQWFIQGADHATRLAPLWEPAVAKLIEAWRKLEDCEASKVQMLELASGAATEDAPGRRARKKRQVVTDRLGGLEAYDAALAALRARRDKRAAWRLRETDASWEKLPAGARPIRPPPLFSSFGEKHVPEDGAPRLPPADLGPAIKRLEAAKGRFTIILRTNKH